MILVDTSVWEAHFRAPVARLVKLLGDGEAVVHPYVAAELALGNLKERARTIALLRAMPAPPKASDEQLLDFIEENRLAGSGIGPVDAHLLASCRLDPFLRLWTHDKRLAERAESLGLAWKKDAE